MKTPTDTRANSLKTGIQRVSTCVGGTEKNSLAL
jgi:hypothetical protein